jgi:hypothetical protein
MTTTIRLVLLSAIAICLSGCGSCSDAGGNLNTNANNATIVVPKADNTNNPYGSNANSKLVPYNGSENLNGNPTLDNSKITVVDTSKVKPTITTRPLPEDSELSTVMNSKGNVIETRTFKNNPYISKLERVTVTPKDVSLKLYLKNGTVRELPADKVKDFRIVATGTLLDIIGFKYPKDSAPKAKSKEELMKEQGLKKKP